MFQMPEKSWQFELKRKIKDCLHFCGFPWPFDSCLILMKALFSVKALHKLLRNCMTGWVSKNGKCNLKFFNYSQQLNKNDLIKCSIFSTVMAPLFIDMAARKPNDTAGRSHIVTTISSFATSSCAICRFLEEMNMRRLTYKKTTYQ
jgi:hypothetical protein